MDRIEQHTGYPISVSMFEKDLATMRNIPEPFNFAPIKYNRGENYYYYDDPIYSLSKISLKEDEMESIEMASAILEQYSHLPFMRQFVDTVKQIRTMVKTTHQYDEQNPVNHVKLKRATKSGGQQYFQSLDTAIRERSVVIFRYHSFNTDKASDYILHPYLLNEYEGRWYVVGMSDEHGEIRTFGLDRIISLSIETKIKYKVSDFNPDEYFKHTLGFVRPSKGKPEKILLKFNKLRGKYLLSQPIHESQNLIKEGKDYYIFEFYLYHTFELETRILSWGDSVMVVSPPKLKKNIIGILDNNLKQYI